MLGTVRARKVPQLPPSSKSQSPQQYPLYVDMSISEHQGHVSFSFCLSGLKQIEVLFAGLRQDSWHTR
jgi:hypothetical protein